MLNPTWAYDIQATQFLHEHDHPDKKKSGLDETTNYLHFIHNNTRKS